MVFSAPREVFCQVLSYFGAGDKKAGEGGGREDPAGCVGMLSGWQIALRWHQPGSARLSA